MAETVNVAQARDVLRNLGPTAERELERAQEAHAQALAAQGAVDAYALGGSAVYVGASIRANGYEVLVGGGGGTSGGGTVDDLVLGNLVGSAIYPQFPARNEAGYFLGDQVDALAAGDDPWGQADSDALGRAIRKA